MRLGLCCEPLVAERGLEETVELAAGIGYDGCELAIWDIADSGRPTRAERRAARESLDRHGIDLVGIYRPFVPSSDHSVTSLDADRRARTAAHLAGVAEDCAALGGSTIVFGSPEQRAVPEGASEATARENLVETLRSEVLLSALDRTGVTLCLEPLTWKTAFLSTAAEMAAVVEAVDHDRVQLVLDSYHLDRECDDESAVAETLRRFAPHLAHVHLDDPTGRGPGSGSLDCRPLVETLDAVGYDGWLSVEFHEFYLDGNEDGNGEEASAWETWARESYRYLEGIA